MLTILNYYDKISNGDGMNNDFIIKNMHAVILVGRNEHKGKTLRFTSQLSHNELIFHISGEATVYFNGKKLEVRENTIRFLPKGENREYIVEKKSFGECIDIFFDTDNPISDEAFTINLNKNAQIGNLFKKLFSLWVSKNEGYYFECISLLYKILAQMQKQNYIPENQYDAIKPAISYIEENFLKEKISIPALCEKCKISETYLKKLFIKKFGVPPVKYIIQMKINFAEDLLRSKLYSVSQVAELCGYENLYYFSRQFKEYRGISPTTFAEKYKNTK